MVEKRLVPINPEFFKFPTTNKTRKNRPENDQSATIPPKIKVKDPTIKRSTKDQTSKTIKKNLLNYIRKHQQDRYDEMKKQKDSTPTIHDSNTIQTSNDFQDSLNYLMKLTKENEHHQHHPPPISHNRTIRNHSPTITTTTTNENVSMNLPIEFVQPPSTNSPPIYIHRPIPPPQYGCLKNGNLPTYRQWQNKTQKNIYSSNMSSPPPNVPHTPIQMMCSKEQLLQDKIAELKQKSNINPLASSPIFSGGNTMMQKKQIIHGKKMEKHQQEAKRAAMLRKIPKRRKTMRRTYRVGRSKIAPKISVLVSNKTIRKNIYTQSLLLKQTPIKEVKQYLIKQGFIRIGSIAPNSVLRKMYESAKLLCGEVRNHNPDNLLYNFLHGGGSQEDGH